MKGTSVSCETTLGSLIYESLESLKESKETLGKMREETIVEKVPNVMKTINPQIQVAQRLSQAWNLKKIIPHEVLLKFIKAHDKENIFKAAREKRRLCTEDQK